MHSVSVVELSVNTRYKIKIMSVAQQCSYDNFMSVAKMQITRYLSAINYIPATFHIHISVHRNVIPNYSQQDATFLEFIYFYRRSTCFRRFLRPSSGAHNCTYSFRYCQPVLLLAATVEEMERTVAASSSTGWQDLKLYVQLCAPDDKRRNRLKHVQRL